MSSRRSETLALTIAASILILAYLGLAFVHMRAPFMDDETWEFYAAKTLLEEGEARTVTGEQNVFHPHGYYYVLAASFRVLGVHEAAARSIGMIATALCFLVLLRMIRRLAGALDVASVVLCGGFYLLAPLVIQGSLIITADTAIHHLAVALFLLYAIERHPFRRVDYCALAGLFAACLWIKIVTPCLVMASIVCFFLVRREWRAAAATCAAGCGGALIFAGTWSIYCHALGADPWIAADYLVKTAESRTAAVSVTAKALWLARQTLVVLLWLGLPMALAMSMAIVTWPRWRTSFSPATGMLFCAGCVLLVFYTVIAGASFGFPRYHFAVMPMWAVLLTLFTRRAVAAGKLPAIGFASALAAGAVWLYFAAGDPLHAVNYELKLAMLGDSEFGSHRASAIAKRLTLLALPCLAVAAYALRRRSMARCVTLAVALAFGMNLALAFLQARADYQTALCYGEEGTQSVHAYLDSRLEPERTLVASKDVVYHTADRGYMEDWRWTEREYLLRRLADPATQFLVMGVQHNTIEQLRAVGEDPGLRRLLDEQYRRTRIGTYWIWERQPSLHSEARGQ